ncbi:MAG: YdcF family protein [Treponema sp.]|jgi:uncharacterized SAM-binding protein YcdF (DUF218 family)|nr:YdcF family protein [Treponema sp.]
MKIISQSIIYNITILNKLKKTGIILKYIIIAICVSGFVYIIFAVFDIYYFSFVNELAFADAAVILGAGVRDNRPSPVFQERINHGIWLYKNKYVKYLIFTGGTGRGSNVSESSVAEKYAVHNSVPAENIFKEEMSRITLENLIYAKKIIKDNNLDKIIIVSDPLHMKRSITMAKDLKLNCYSSPTPTTRYISLNVRLKFLLYELFFHIIYKIYRYSLPIVLYLFLFEFMFIICYYKTMAL